MFSQAIIAAVQTFAAILGFVTVCLGLAKVLIEAGFLKKLHRQ